MEQCSAEGRSGKKRSFAARSSALDFVLEATEESIVKQLTELLKSRDLTCDELGLLYCYKHGVSTNQALKTIGIDAKLAQLFSEWHNCSHELNRAVIPRRATLPQVALIHMLDL